VDTEGYDLTVLEGAYDVLPKTRYVVVEQNIEHVRNLLQKLGFEPHSLFPSGYLAATNKNLYHVQNV